MRHLDSRAVLNIHEQLVRDFGASGDPIDPPGPREGGILLESAVTRPLTSLGGKPKYPTIEMAAAALLHALVHDHPFHNGNKRTGIVALLVFLDMNGYVLQAEERELFDYVLHLSGHSAAPTDNYVAPTDMSMPDAETLYAARWISQHARKLAKHQHTMQWRALESILRQHDCEFEQRTGNSIAIRRGNLIAHTGRRNPGEDIDVDGVAYIRKQLELDEEHGVDSATFYYAESAVPAFINRYRQLLRRLASY